MNDSHQFDEPPILITSAITTSASFTKVTDSTIRLRETLKDLSKWMELCPRTRFVICDGSGFDVGKHLSTGTIDPARIESLVFVNDLAQVRVKGKGFGEGQIIKYALRNSSILKAAKTFGKCTGKLWVDNFHACKRSFNGTAGFGFFGFPRPVRLDTRFFLIDRQFFEGNLIDAYLGCNDAESQDLETVYLAALSVFHPKQWILTRTPRIRGLSGSMDLYYQSTSRLRTFVRDLAIRMLYPS